jgi:hypothetical protein
VTPVTGERRVELSANVTCPSCSRRVSTQHRHCAFKGCSWFTCPRCGALVEIVTRVYRRGMWSGPGGSI